MILSIIMIRQIIEQATSKNLHKKYLNQLLQFTELQSKTRGKGQHRKDWPTAIEQERRHALNIGKAKYKASNKESQPAN